MRVSTSFGGHSESNFAASSKMISHSGSSAAFLPRLASPFILLVNILDFDQSFGARIFISPRISQSQVRSGCSSGSYKAQFSNLTSFLSFHSFFIFPPLSFLPPSPPCLLVLFSTCHQAPLLSVLLPQHLGLSLPATTLTAYSTSL